VSGVRAPWGSVLLVLAFADAVSLWLFFRIVRGAGVHGLAAATLVVLYVVLAFSVGMWALRAGAGLSLGAALEAWRTARSPEDDLLNALLAVLGGLLIAFPGVVSDVLGLVLLLPGARAAPRAMLRRAMAERRGAREPGPLDVEEYRVE